MSAPPSCVLPLTLIHLYKWLGYISLHCAQM